MSYSNPNDKPIDENGYPEDFFSKREMNTYEVEKIIKANGSGGCAVIIFAIGLMVVIGMLTNRLGEVAAQIQTLREQVSELQKRIGIAK